MSSVVNSINPSTGNEPDPTNIAQNRLQGTTNSLARFTTDQGYENNQGSLASTLTPINPGKPIDVLREYPWTVTNTKTRNDIPFVELREYKCNESQIKRQWDFYSKLTPETIAGAFGATSSKKAVLSVYTEIFSHEYPTEFRYVFPYFNKIGFDLSTQNWQAIDPIGESLKKFAGGTQSFLSNFGDFGKAAGKVVNGIVKTGEFVQAASETALLARYPTAGTQDRPRVFAGHSERQITISFPLFNTLHENDYIKNRDLIYVLMSQNLYNKRDYITGVPPVFYDVHIPGQYYCYAAAMTNINVENLGNVRLVDYSYIIPDAYQVTLTLTEMVTPSKNQFEAMTTGNPYSVVSASEKPNADTGTSANVAQNANAANPQTTP
jgi:hypothetical protein